MNYVRFIFQHTLATLRSHIWLFLFLATAHFATNAAFTAFVSFAFGILFHGSKVQPEMVGWVANAPLTASLAVIITSLTFGIRESSQIINWRFYKVWFPVTLMFAWSYYFAWYSQTAFPANMTWFVSQRPWLTEYLPVSFFNQTVPWICTVFVASVATLSVPAIVAGRQRLWHHRAVIAQTIVVIATAAFMLAREKYRVFAGDLNPYHWLPFPGYNPQGIAYDQILHAFIELPFLIPASVFITCLTAALVVAVDLDRLSTVKL